MIKFALSPALLSATGWFIGMLAVMIIVTALFALVLVLALKPVKTFEADDDMSKKLERRETELTIELLKSSNDPKRTEYLLKELREVTSAEKLVNRIIDEENSSEKSAAQQSGNAPAGQQKPARPRGAQQPNPAAQQRPVQPQGAQQPNPAAQQRPVQPQGAQQPNPAAQQRPVQPQGAQQPKPAVQQRSVQPQGAPAKQPAQPKASGRPDGQSRAKPGEENKKG